MYANCFSFWGLGPPHCLPWLRPRTPLRDFRLQAPGAVAAYTGWAMHPVYSRITELYRLEQRLRITVKVGRTSHGTEHNARTKLQQARIQRGNYLTPISAHETTQTRNNSYSTVESTPRKAVSGILAK